MSALPLRTGVVLGAYVVPVALTVFFLAHVGLVVMAVALAVLEILTVAAIQWAVRTEPQARPAGQPVLGVRGAQRTAQATPRQWALLGAMLVGAIVVPIVIASALSA